MQGPPFDEHPARCVVRSADQGRYRGQIMMLSLHAIRSSASGQSRSRVVYRGDVTDTPLSAGELRAAAETHKELGPEYRDAVLESFVERVGREIDARVDARLAQAAVRPVAPQPAPPPPAKQPKPFSPLAMALG